MSKRKNYQAERRRIRRREKKSTVKAEAMMGRVCRRLYGGGVAHSE
jgi:hypothetical protein